MYTGEPASFWRENVLAVVILLRVFARMLWCRKQDINILRLGERVTSFTKDNNAINWKVKLSGSLSLGKTWKNFKSQGAKKVIVTACHSGKLKLTFTSPNIISTSPKNVLMSRLISKFFCNLNSSKKFTCPSGKLITEFTSPIAKSTSPRLSDTTFFARWVKSHTRSRPHIGVPHTHLSLVRLP